MKHEDLRLEIPYAHDRELIMDIQKHGMHCEVLGPKGLREAVLKELDHTLLPYRNTSD